jgi:hypothetical protein
MSVLLTIPVIDHSSSLLQRCDGVRPVCRTCRVAKQEGHCEYDNDYIPALQEENQVYKDKIQELQAALAAAQALASGSEASGSSNEGNEGFGMAALTVDMPSRQDGDHAMHTFQPGQLSGYMERV